MSKREDELLKKIEELEARIRQLEAQPPIQYHYHQYPSPQPYYIPAPAPLIPFVPHYPSTTWGGGASDIGGAAAS